MERNWKTCAPWLERVRDLAANKLKLGYWFTEIGMAGPTLEASLAAVAMAQGELGHGRLLLTWLRELTGETIDEAQFLERYGYRRAADEADWVALMGIAFGLLAVADLSLRAWAARETEIASRLRKLFAEQAEHLAFVEEWVRLLLNDAPAVQERTRLCLMRTRQWAEGWIASLDDPGLAAVGLALDAETGKGELARMYSRLLVGAGVR